MKSNCVNAERGTRSAERSRVFRLPLLAAFWLAASAPAGHAAGLSFTPGSVSGPPAAEVLVPVQASGFANVSLFQFSFHWNPAVAGFMGVEQFGLPGLGSGNFGTTLTNSGTLTVSWDDPDGASKSLAEGAAVFAVRLKLVGAAGASSPLTIDGSPTPIEAADGALESMAVSVGAGVLSVGPAITAPAITAQPQAVSVTAGATAVFSVAASGSAPLSWLWRWNGLPLPEAWPVSISNSLSGSTLVLSNVQVSQAGAFSVVVSNAGGWVVSSAASLSVAPPANTPPALSAVADQFIGRNQPLGPLAFTVGDAETAAEALAVSVVCSDAALVPPGNLSMGGSGSNRWLSLVPGSNQVGSAVITITVVDGGAPALSASRSFALTVEGLGLAAHWRLDEVSGVLAMDSAGANTGSLMNGASRVAGRLGGALALDGVDDFVNVPDHASLDVSNRMSLSLWFKPGRLLDTASGRKDLLRKLNAYWLIFGYPQADGRLAFVFNAGSPLVKSSTSVWHSNVWYHAAATYDGGMMRLYVNGALEGSSATTVPANVNGAALQIGGNSDFGIYFPGCIDDVRIYNTALSGAEVAALFASGAVNTAPELRVPGTEFRVDEGGVLSFTAAGSDVDLPAQSLRFSLDADPPLGAAIDAVSGVFSWSPSEGQGPGVYAITVRVSDNGSPPRSAAATVSVVVNEVNRAPVLPPVASRSVNEGTLVAFAAGASDADVPAQNLSYRLVGAPTGASVNGAGVFSWTPSEAQGPGVYEMGLVAMDDGPGSLSVTQGFTISVLEVNNGPTLAPVGDLAAEVLVGLRVTNAVSDADVPSNAVTFVVLEGPKGVRVNRFTGVVSWTPDRSQAPSTNRIVVVASDDGVPPLSATNVFTVTVGDFVELGLGQAVLRSGQPGGVPMDLMASAGITNLAAMLQVGSWNAQQATLGGFGLALSGPELRGAIGAEGAQGRLLELGSSGTPLLGSRRLGELQFTGVATQSAFVPLLLSNVSARRPSGTLVPRTLSGNGRVVVLANEPLLEAMVTTNRERVLVLYGEPGPGYVVESSPEPGANGLWQLAWEGALTNVTQFITAQGMTNGTKYFRAYRR